MNRIIKTIQEEIKYHKELGENITLGDVIEFIIKEKDLIQMTIKIHKSGRATAKLIAKGLGTDDLIKHDKQTKIYNKELKFITQEGLAFEFLPKGKYEVQQ